MPCVARITDGVGEGLREPASPPTVVGDPGSIGNGIVQGKDGILGRSPSGGVEELQSHELDAPVDPDHTNAIVANGPDYAGDVCAVAVIVERIAILVREV